MPANNRIRIIVVDDHAVIRTSLRMLIESIERFTVVGEAHDRASALTVAEREQPDVVLLDLDLGGDSGLEVLDDLLRSVEEVRVLILTGFCSEETQAEVVRRGAMGLVMKQQAAEVLLKAIDRVYDGELWFDRSLMKRVIAQTTSSAGKAKSASEEDKLRTITPREREIITLVGEGLKNKDIAERLFISQRTVRNHLTSIFSKLDVSDRLELLLYAYKHNLTKPPTQH